MLEALRPINDSLEPRVHQPVTQLGADILGREERLDEATAVVDKPAEEEDHGHAHAH